MRIYSKINDFLVKTGKITVYDSNCQQNKSCFLKTGKNTIYDNNYKNTRNTVTNSSVLILRVFLFSFFFFFFSCEKQKRWMCEYS